MNTGKRATTTAALVVTIAACGAGWLLRLRCENFRIAAQVARERTNILTAEWHRDLDRRRAAVERTVTTHQAARNQGPLPEWIRGFAEGDPAATNRFLARGRLRKAIIFAPLFRQLRLTPPQIAAILDALSELDAAYADLRAAAAAQGLGESDPVFGKLSGDIWRSAQKKEKEVLGASGFEQFAAFQRQEGIRGMVNDTVGAAIAAGLDFTPKQVQQLTGLMATAVHIGQPVDWAWIDQRAAKFLSAEQLAYLQNADPAVGGAGGRHQYDLNTLITLADAADTQAATAARR